MDQQQAENNLEIHLFCYLKQEFIASNGNALNYGYTHKPNSIIIFGKDANVNDVFSMVVCKIKDNTGMDKN